MPRHPLLHSLYTIVNRPRRPLRRTLVSDLIGVASPQRHLTRQAPPVGDSPTEGTTHLLIGACTFKVDGSCIAIERRPASPLRTLLPRRQAELASCSPESADSTQSATGRSRLASTFRRARVLCRRTRQRVVAAGSKLMAAVRYSHYERGKSRPVDADRGRLPASRPRATPCGAPAVPKRHLGRVVWPLLGPRLEKGSPSSPPSPPFLHNVERRSGRLP